MNCGRQLRAGNGGIGTAGPRAKLEINNTAGFASEYDEGTVRKKEWDYLSKRRNCSTVR